MQLNLKSFVIILLQSSLSAILAGLIRLELASKNNYGVLLTLKVRIQLFLLPADNPFSNENQTDVNLLQIRGDKNE